MGSSTSSAPPAPDLTNVMQNIGRVQETMYGWGTQAWDFIQGQAKALQPFVTHGQETAQAMGDSARALVDKIRGQYDAYTPLRDKNIEQAMNFDSPANIERWQGMSTAQLAQQAQQAGANAKSALIDYGVKPTDARFGLDLPIRLNQMASTAGQNNSIRMGLETAGHQMRGGVLNQGQQEQNLGNQTGALALQGAAAPMAIGGAYTQAMFPWMNPQNAMETSGNMAVNQGRLYNDAYKNAIAAWGAENAQGGSGTGTALGMLGSQNWGDILKQGNTILNQTPTTSTVPGNAQGGTVKAYDDGGTIEGGRQQGEDYDQHHARDAAPNEGHLRQHVGTVGSAAPAADPRVNGMYGAGALSDGHMGWRKYYGGGMVKAGASEGYAQGDVVDPQQAQMQQPVLNTQPLQRGMPVRVDPRQQLRLDPRLMQAPMGLRDDEAPLEAPDVKPFLPRGAPNRLDPRRRLQMHAGGDSVQPISEQGGYVSPSLSPSGGRVVDDIPAVIQNTSPQRPAAINAGEFIFTTKAAREIGHEKLRRMMKQAEAKADGTMKPGSTPGGAIRQTSGRDRPNMAGRRPVPGFYRGGPLGGEQGYDASWDDWTNMAPSLSSQDPTGYGGYFTDLLDIFGDAAGGADHDKVKGDAFGIFPDSESDQGEQLGGSIGRFGGRVIGGIYGAPGVGAQIGEGLGTGVGAMVQGRVGEGFENIGRGVVGGIGENVKSIPGIGGIMGDEEGEGGGGGAGGVLGGIGGAGGGGGAGGMLGPLQGMLGGGQQKGSKGGGMPYGFGPYIDAHDGGYLAKRGGKVPGGVLQTGRRARPFAKAAA